MKAAGYEFEFGTQTVMRPVKLISGIPTILLQPSKTTVYGDDGFTKLTMPTNMRDRNGQVIKLEVTVPSCKVRIEGDGPLCTGILEGRSCCKPPDKFDRVVGKRLALAHLFEQDTGHTLSRKDRTAIMERCVPQLYKKKPAALPPAETPPTVPGSPVAKTEVTT